MKYDWSNLTENYASKWLKLCPYDTYGVVPPSEITGLLPDSLVGKYDSVLLMSSGIKDTNDVVFMANGSRVDVKDSAIDQMPFGFGYISCGNTSGLLIQHGSWSDRTSNPPQQFWTELQTSGIGRCYPLSILPSKPTGMLSELQISSQTSGAFAALVEGLKSQYPNLMA